MLDFTTAMSSTVSSSACFIHDRKSEPLPNQSTTSTIGLASEFRKSRPSVPAMKMAGGSEFPIFTSLLCSPRTTDPDAQDLTC
jgi:hypothetical protein